MNKRLYTYCFLRAVVPAPYEIAIGIESFFLTKNFSIRLFYINTHFIRVITSGTLAIDITVEKNRI